MTRHSKYCYPNTDVLINKVGITDQMQLTAFENDMTSMRVSDLRIEPIKGIFDLRHLSSIHRYIFQDVYSFAGKIRDENIAKGTTRFAVCAYIESSFAEIVRSLRHENFLCGVSQEEFATRAAFYMGEINMVHPFREGNGRAQREYVRCLALQSDYSLDWDTVNHSEILDATIQSVRNSDRLAEVIYQCIR